MSELLTIQDVLRARVVIATHLRPTPLHSYPSLNRLLGMELYVKHENHALIGSFKARGAINALAAHADAGRVVAYSTGNHGQGVSYAARLLGMQATIVMPERANPEKAAAIEALGGRVVFHGQTLDQAQRRAQELTDEQGAYYADDGGDMLIAAGAGTVALEILEQVPDLDELVIPLGDGMLAGGCCVALRALAPGARSLAVQSEACPAMVESWRRGEVLRIECRTFAEGLADVQPHAVALQLLREVLDDALLVSEQEIKSAIRTLLQHTHNLAEGAGAAPMAACTRERERLAGKKVAIILSGGNLDTRLLPEILQAS
jgi:threonine dehydratase